MEMMSLAINKSLFYLNTAELDGGAIFSKQYQRGSVMLTAINATMNSAKNGGFLYSFKCNVSIENLCHIVGNEATKGGAIFSRDSSIKMTGFPLQELSFINNTAQDSGGGIYDVFLFGQNRSAV